MNLRSIFPLVATSLLLLSGCGGGASLAEVSGKVTDENGQPVTSGTITFNPVSTGDGNPGKSASGEIGSDGTYKLSTYKANDGAQLGKHRVSYSPPAGDDDAPASSRPNYTVKGGEMTVEVKSGANDIPISLQRQ